MYIVFAAFMILLFVLANIKFNRRKPDLRKKHAVSGETLFIMAVSLFFLIVFALQSATSNGDLMRYLASYNRFSTYGFSRYDSIVNNTKDPFYYICGSIFAHLGFDFYAWRFLIAFVYIMSVYIIISKYSSNIYVSFIVLIVIGTFPFTLSGLRQTLALAILMHTFKCLENKKFIKFVLLVLLASLFHSSAIIFLLAYPIYFIKLRFRNYLLLSIVSVFVIFNARSLIALFVELTGAYDAYGGYIEKDEVLTFAGVIIFTFVLGFSLVSYHFGADDVKYPGLCNLAFVALLFRILAFTTVAELFRISMYFDLFDVLLIAEACTCGEKKRFTQQMKTLGATSAMTAYYFVSAYTFTTSFVIR